MIKLLSVNPTGYFSYGISKPIHLDGLGLVLLEGINNDRAGGSNGAGKTSLLNVISHLLFECNPSGYTGEKITNAKLGKRFGRLVFETSDGTRWRITETRKWKKSDTIPEECNEPSDIDSTGGYVGNDLYFDKYVNGKWVDYRATNLAGESKLSMRHTRNLISSVIGSTYEQFMSVAYLAQQSTLEFINGKHKARLETLSALGDLGVWDNRIARIKADRQAKEAELAKIDIDLSYMHGLLVNKPDETRVQELALQVQIASNDASEAFDVAESIKLRIRQASEDNTNISTRLSDIAKEMRSITSDINSIESQLASLHRAYLEQVAEVSIDKPTPEMVDHQNAIQFINGQIASKRYDLEQMLPGAGKCNRCGSNVSFEHLERQKSLIKVSISELEEKLAYHTEEYNKAATAHQVATLEKLNNLESELEKNKAPLEDQLSALKTKYSKAEIQFNLLKIEQSNLSTKLDKLHKEYNEALRIHNDKVKKHYELELLYKNELSNLDAWHQNKSKLDTLMAMRSTVAEEIDILDTLERLFGDRGLKAMRLDNIISTLNSFIDSGLKLLTDGQVKVKISSTRKKSDGDTTIDINIMVQEGPKEDIPFQLYSGGERQQITLAIVNALSEYASLNGVGYNILCLDEIFGPLDDTNSQLVYRYLEYKKSRGSSTIFIITHNPEVKNQLKFDKILTVVKKDGLSTIEGI